MLLNKTFEYKLLDFNSIIFVNWIIATTKTAGEVVLEKKKKWTTV